MSDKEISQKNEEFENQMENLGPTSNEAELKELMKSLDREQAYREHKCSFPTLFKHYRNGNCTNFTCNTSCLCPDACISSFSGNKKITAQSPAMV